jgi:hypothetical protein
VWSGRSEEWGARGEIAGVKLRIKRGGA